MKNYQKLAALILAIGSSIPGAYARGQEGCQLEGNSCFDSTPVARYDVRPVLSCQPVEGSFSRDSYGRPQPLLFGPVSHEDLYGGNVRPGKTELVIQPANGPKQIGGTPILKYTNKTIFFLGTKGKNVFEPDVGIADRLNAKNGYLLTNLRAEDFIATGEYRDNGLGDGFIIVPKEVLIQSELPEDIQITAFNHRDASTPFQRSFTLSRDANGNYTGTYLDLNRDEKEIAKGGVVCTVVAKTLNQHLRDIDGEVVEPGIKQLQD